MSQEQAAALEQLGASLEAFGGALAACLQAGLQPAEALRACGLEVPAWAGVMVNRSLGQLLAVEEVSAEGLQS